MITSRQVATAIAGATAITWMAGIGSFNIRVADRVNPDTGIQSASSINLGFGASALAAEPGKFNSGGIQYSPPHRGDLGDESGVGAGSRGCQSQTPPVSLTALAPPPNDHTALTASGHPTFVWYVSDTSVPIQFTLVEMKPEGRGGTTLLKQVLQAEKSGFMQLAMPKNLPELDPNKTYYWTVSLECNPERADTYIVSKFWIKRAIMTPEQASKIAGATSEQERARLYAQFLYWYDAVNVLSTAYNAQPKDQSTVDEFISLLNQGGIKTSDLQHFPQETTR